MPGSSYIQRNNTKLCVNLPTKLILRLPMSTFHLIWCQVHSGTTTPNLINSRHPLSLPIIANMIVKGYVVPINYMHIAPSASVSYCLTNTLRYPTFFFFCSVICIVLQGLLASFYHSTPPKPLTSSFHSCALFYKACMQD